MKKTKVLKICGGIVGLLVVCAAALLTGLVPSPFNLMRRGPPQKDMPVDQAVRSQVIDSLIAQLNANYVFPEKARELESMLHAQQQKGAYDKIVSAQKLAETLTADLQASVKDGHLEVQYSEAPVPEGNKDRKDDDAPSPQMLEDMKRLNYGLAKVERLSFNIGYIDLRVFAPAALAGKKVGAAMALMSDTTALIVDLRSNHGGSPEMVALFASYFFDARTHLNDIVWREGNRTEESWTSEQVVGPKYGSERALIILTSSETFSAAEDFTYAMKNLKRATIIGETTGGGAHPGGPRRLHEHFEASVPNGRSLSPITHADWEGVGVAPDTNVRASRALALAQVQLLKARLATEKDPMVKSRMEDRISELD